MIATINEDTARKSAAKFYDDLASDYDAMTGFEKRFIKEKPFFHLIVQTHNIKTALDAGCGTGFHSLLLARLGVDVTAVDISSVMLDRVIEHARQMDVKLHTIRARFQDLNRQVKKKYDAVFCMGNSLAHLLSATELNKALTNFHAVLNSPGMLFMQNLNYNRITRLREKIQSVKQAGGKTFVRFYEYHRNKILFNILTLEHRGGEMKYHLNQTELRPVLMDELLRQLEDVGFTDVKMFGGITREDFQPMHSKDLVVLTKKK